MYTMYTMNTIQPLKKNETLSSVMDLEGIMLSENKQRGERQVQYVEFKKAKQNNTDTENRSVVTGGEEG